MADIAASMETSATVSTGVSDQPSAHAALLVGERSLFMRNSITCAACRLKPIAAGRRSAERLHVSITATEMIVTEADDLHQPGRSIRCEQMLSFPGGLMFHVTALRSSRGVEQAGIAGMAFLSRYNRRWHLKVFGHAEGVEAFHGCLIDAVEED